MTCGALVPTLGPLWAQSIQLLHSPANRETLKAGLVVERDVVLRHPCPRAPGASAKAVGE